MKHYIVFGTALSAWVLLLLCGLFLPKSHASPTANLPPPSSNSQPSTSSPQQPNWWTAVQQELRHREYHITWQESPLISGELLHASQSSAGVYQAPNRAQNLRSGFYPTGIQVVERTAAISSWTFGLATVGVEHGGAAAALPLPTLSVRQNRATYHHSSSLTESYLNDENGLEHTIEIPDIHSPTSNPRYPTPKPQILLQLTLTGDLAPHLDDETQAIQLTDGQGIPILQYGPLQVTDPTGHPIPIHLQLKTQQPSNPTQHASPATHHSLRITIDTPTAYPITLHSRLTSASRSPADSTELTQAWIGESDRNDAQFGYALSTAGDVDGDGYSDLIVGAPWYDGGQPGEGAVFLYHGSATGLAVGPADWITESNQENSHLGYAVSIAGDVNGDGYADVIIGAPDHDVVYTSTETDAGQVHVFYGSPAGLAVGHPSWLATGDQENGHFGQSVSTAGDVNHDGYADIIIGVPDHDGLYPDGGAAFVYYGGPDGLAIGPPNWMAIGDQLGAHLGTAVSTAGDVDSDGYADVAIGAPEYDLTGTAILTNTGQAYVYYGSSTGLVTSTTVITRVWTAGGDQADAHFGLVVSTAGDVNGDGYSDLLVGAPGYDVVGTVTITAAGQAYVFYGGLDGLTPGPANWVATGSQENARFGAAVSVAGDVNSDGYADIVVGAPGYTGIQSGEGAAFVYRGGPAGLPAAPNWSAHPTSQEDARFGVAVSPAGDVNGDGHSDLAIGAAGYDNGQEDEGAAFVYYGSTTGLATIPVWDTVGAQEGALVGWSVSSAGDVNGDGYGDVIVGAPRYDHGQAGEGMAFLYPGGPDGPSSDPTWLGESDQEWAWFGHAVASAGDVNGDGYSDVIVSANGYDGEALNEGAAFVYHGGPSGLVTSTTWTAHPTDQADARFGQAAATAGDVNGDGYADVIVTANGYDGQEINEGAAFVYHGGPSGLVTATTWVVHPTDQAYANFGRSAASAGDVNGDGYSDVIIGAPWYDNPLSPYVHIYDGSAFVYYGGPTGLATGPADWMITQVFTDSECGTAVSTAGDVNGDGYSDVIVGIYKYTERLWVTPWREGAALVYHGGPTGLTIGRADWIATSGQRQAKFGITVSTAGDVNGDGYGDVVVGASNYADGESNEGAAFVFHGGPAGLTTGPADWITQGNQEGAAHGFAVSAAGDVNGDGYGDLIVGAPTYNGGRIDVGAAFVYLGNGTNGFPMLPNQIRPTLGEAPISSTFSLTERTAPSASPSSGKTTPATSPLLGGIEEGTPIASLGQSNHANQVHLQLAARSPLGRQPLALQWQVAPLGTPFTATSALSGTSTSTDASIFLSKTIADLTAGTVYRWRVRTLYQSGNRLGQIASRWMYLPWNGPQEADFRTPSLLAPDRQSTIAPGYAAVYTHTLINPISGTQTFTLTAASSSSATLTITVALPSGMPTATLLAFDRSPVTVTVYISPTVISATETTIVTATGSLSGYDTVRDVTTITWPAAADLSDTLLPLILRHSMPP
jgi:hypothetical protein